MIESPSMALLPEGCWEYSDEEAENSPWFAEAMLQMARYYSCSHPKAKNPGQQKMAFFCSRIGCPFLATEEPFDGRGPEQGVAFKHPRRP